MPDTLNHSFIRPSLLVEAKNELVHYLIRDLYNLYLQVATVIRQDLQGKPLTHNNPWSPQGAPDAQDLSERTKMALSKSPFSSLVEVVEPDEGEHGSGAAIWLKPVPLEGPLEVFNRDHQGNPTNYQGTELEIFIRFSDARTTGQVSIYDDPPVGHLLIDISLNELMADDSVYDIFIHECTHLIDILSALRTSRRAANKFLNLPVVGRAINSRAKEAEVRVWPGIKSVITKALNINPDATADEASTKNFNYLLYRMHPSELRAFTSDISSRIIAYYDDFRKQSPATSNGKAKELFLRALTIPYTKLGGGAVGELLTYAYSDIIRSAMKALNVSEPQAYEFLEQTGTIRIVQKELIDQVSKYIDELYPQT